MKKVFPFQQPGHADARVVEAVKHDVHRYLKRERRKKLPEGFDSWAFACKVGPDQAGATDCGLAEISSRIDALVQVGGRQAYVEIIARPEKRMRGDDFPTSEA